MVNTARVGKAPAANATRRLTPVLNTGANDPWGGSWGQAWGASWGTPGYSLGLLADNTPRVTGTPMANSTKRVEGE